MPAPPPVRCAVIGGTGYTAFELVRLLQRHPHADVVAMTSRTDRRPVAAVHPALDGLLDLSLEDLDPAAVARRADVAFCCLPHVASMGVVPRLLDEGLKVVDLSADYRLADPAVYEHWYGQVHTDPTRLGSVAYGLPELFRDKIKGQSLIANPGCNATTAILGLAPLLAAGVIEPGGIVVDNKTGVSGAGRSPKVGTLFAEANESVSPYGVGTHRHQPEIEQVLADSTGVTPEVLFVSHLIPMDRGILATIYATPRDFGPNATVSQSDYEAVLREYYADEPFITVTDQLPGTKAVSGTNRVRLSVRLTEGRGGAKRVVVMSTLDNLLKGASGAAVQNFNLMYGFEETTALV